MTRRAGINLGMAALVALLTAGALSGLAGPAGATSGSTATSTATSAPPSPPPALQAEAQQLAMAEAQQQTGADTAASPDVAGATLSPSTTASPDSTTIVNAPINTVLGPYTGYGCTMYAEYGNIYGVAYGKAEIYNAGSPSCAVSAYILAYYNGNYIWGNVATAAGEQGWTNPQSQVDGYYVVSEYVDACNPTQCADYQFNAV